MPLCMFIFMCDAPLLNNLLYLPQLHAQGTGEESSEQGEIQAYPQPVPASPNKQRHQLSTPSASLKPVATTSTPTSLRLSGHSPAHTGHDQASTERFPVSNDFTLDKFSRNLLYAAHYANIHIHIQHIHTTNTHMHKYTNNMHVFNHILSIEQRTRGERRGRGR